VHSRTHNANTPCRRYSAAARDIRKGGDHGMDIYREMPRQRTVNEKLFGRGTTIRLFIQTRRARRRRQIHFAAASRFISKARFRLADARKVNMHLCVWGQLKCISPPSSLSLSDRIGSDAQLMEACRLSEITANISSCARPSARALCPTLGARAPRTWGNQIGNYLLLLYTDAM